MKKLIRLTAVFLAAFMLITAAGCSTKQPDTQNNDALADGEYQIAVTLTGGTGKAKVASPTTLTVREGKMTAKIVWSSPNYDYMLVDEVRYEAEITDGHSIFAIPVAALDTELPVIADTVAMSTPHEIEYTITFDAATLTADGQ